MGCEADVLRLHSGSEIWNAWRRESPTYQPDLSGTDISNRDLRGFDFSNCHFGNSDLHECIFTGTALANANLIGANLALADFTGAGLQGADLRGANCILTVFRRCNLTRADFFGVNLSAIDLQGADLTGAELGKTILTHANLREAKLIGSRVFGVSAWEVFLDNAEQQDLIITRPPDPEILVDNIELAQFVFMLLKNNKLREIIDTITSKIVLILGRFTADRKSILDSIREALRQRGFSPVVFDFDKPSSRDLTETVSTLAHLARFVIADITEARSIPQELMAIIPALPSVPIQPLLLAGSPEYGMFEHFRHFPWVLKPFVYTNESHLLDCLRDCVIEPANSRAKEQTGR
jgi:uncharacterized protein YjbI with pentapeptide repeats